MRILLLLPILFAPAQARADAVTRVELRSIELVETKHYQPSGQNGISKFFSGIAVRIGGPNVDLKKKVLDQLNQEALQKYFPDARERDDIARRIANTMHSNFLSNGYSNGNMLAAQRYATNELIMVVAKRVLKEEGVKSAERANTWAIKILEPYNQCMSVARAYTEGSKCSTPMEADLMVNMGLAMTYEMISQQFGKDYARPQVAKYKSCVQPGRQGANERVRDCAMKSFRSTVKDYGRTELETYARKKVPADSAARITSKVLPDFNRCVDSAKDEPGFKKCSDKLLSGAGSEIAFEMVRNERQVREFFTEPADLDRIAEKGREAFLRCLEDNTRANRRDPKSGNIDTDSCEPFIKQEVSRNVAYEFIRRTVEKKMATASAADRSSLVESVSSDLDRCWNSRQPETKNAPCLRKAVVRMANAVAADQIDRELTKETRDENPGLREKLLADFDSCLNRTLPADVAKATNTEAIATNCANGLMRGAAVTIAEKKVRGALSKVAGEFKDKTEMDNLVNIFVKQDFAQCLGDNPDKAKLDRCGLSLQKNVAMQVANALLPFKVIDFFSAMGGPEAYGITDKDREAITKKVLDGHKQCLKTQVKSLDSTESEDQVNNCFKDTIKNLALQVGPLEFDRAARANKIDTTAETFKELQKQFAVDLGLCLEEKRDKKFSIDEYMKGIDSCQGKLTNLFTVRVAKNEISGIAGQVINRVSSTSESERLDGLVGILENCLEKAKDAKGRSACMGDLKRDATFEIVRTGVRQRTLAELKINEIPDELKAMEKNFEKCIKDKQDPDTCGKAHTKASTAWLGKRLINIKLQAELKDKLPALAPEVAKLEKSFDDCIAKADAGLDKVLLAQLEACGSQVTDSVIDFLFTYAEPESTAAPVLASTTEPAGLEKDALADGLSRAILCLNGNLSAENQESLAQVDPTSVEAELLKLLGSYIDYDLKKARGHYEEVLKQANEDLKAAGPEEARKKLLALLVKNGMADQLLKAMIHAELKSKLQAAPADRRPPADLEKALLDKATLEKALTPEVMAKLRAVMEKGVLEPVVVRGLSLKSSPVLRSLTTLRLAAASQLFESPELAPWRADAAAWDKLKGSLETASK